MSRFSVIVPVYNTLPYLKQAIESVLSQTLFNFEILLVDDGSTDGSGRMIDQYTSKDSRIKALHQPQCGVAIARNNAIDVARGEYLIFLDSDDFFSDSRAFEMLSREIDKSKSDIIFYGYVDLDVRTGQTRKSQIGFDPKLFSIEKNDWLNYIYDSGLFPTACWQMALRKSFVDSNNIRFPEKVVCEDIDWGMKALYHAKTYSYVDSCLLTYRRNRNGSIMFSRGLQHLQGCLLAVRNWLDVPKENRYLGLTNFAAHMYGFTFSYYTVIPSTCRKEAEVEFKALDAILLESDKWNHHLIYYTQRLLGITFTAWMIRVVYKLFYAPGSMLGQLRKKLQ